MTEQCSPFHDAEQMVQTKVGVRDQIRAWQDNFGVAGSTVFRSDHMGRTPR
jgi:hypothetical protein